MRSSCPKNLYIKYLLLAEIVKTLVELTALSYELYLLRALIPSNFTIDLHLMYFICQLLQALFVQLVDRQHSDIDDFLQR